MLETIGISVAFAGMFVAVGLPLAVGLRSADDGWAATAADALGFGLLAVVGTVTLGSWLGPIGIVVAGLAGAGVVVEGIVRGRWRRALRRPSWTLALAWGALLVGAMLLRARTVDFLPWVGDMGAYVNWANEFVRTGELAATWPPLFPVFLAVGSAVFGTAWTTAIVPVAGLLLLVAVGRLLARLRLPPWIVWGGTAALAVQQHAVWFSSFPAGEALNAPLFVIWMTLAHRLLTAARGRLVAPAVAVALVSAALCLLRVSGPLLLVPILIVMAGAAIGRGWRPALPRLTLLLASTLPGAAVGLWYGLDRIPEYSVRQLARLLPDAAVAAVDGIGLLSASPLTATLALAAPAALLVLAARLARRAPEPVAGPPTRHPLPTLLGGALLLGAIAVIAIGAKTGGALLRIGVWYVVAAVVALALVAAGRRLDAAGQLLATLLGASAVMYLALDTVLIGFEGAHSFYLYWDRYLVSEILPALLVLTAIAAAELVPLVGGRRVGIPLVAAAAALALLPQLPSLVLQAQHSYLAGAGPFTRQLLAVQQQRPAAPIAWGATRAGPADGFFFPNTWMAFAVPLHRSYGVETLNADQFARDNFAPDEVLDAAALGDFVTASACGAVTVYETQNGGAPLDERVGAADGLVLTPVADLTSQLDLLAQPADAGWTVARIEVRAWAVEATGSPGDC